MGQHPVTQQTTNTSRKDTDNVYTDLVNRAKDNHPIFSKSDDDLGVLFWVALPSGQDADQLKKDHTVLASVAEDKTIRLNKMGSSGTRLRKRGFPTRRRDEPGKVIKQSDAPELLKIVSQPSKDNKPKDLKNFAYREEAGRGVTVYLFDDGANKEANEWIKQPGNKKWIFPGDPNDDRYVIDETETDQSKDGHGSCVYSMAVGTQYGTAKAADVVIVKHAKLKNEDEEDTTESATLDGMTRILADIKLSRLNKKAVVNLSFGVSNDIQEGPKQKFHDIIRDLLANDVVVVTSSGNDRDPDTGDNSDIDENPALFAADLKNMIVVGATDNMGKPWPDSQGGDLLDLSGPADKIVCASQKGTKPQLESGTSYATGSVSGLAAYFLSLPELSDRLKVDGQTAQKVKDFILEKAYSRIDGEVKVLYNNEKSDLK
ncbi:MAG: hypothetical protein Q9213_001546 [Squamulea squamosa]